MFLLPLLCVYLQVFIGLYFSRFLPNIITHSIDLLWDDLSLVWCLLPHSRGLPGGPWLWSPCHGVRDPDPWSTWIFLVTVKVVFWMTFTAISDKDNILDCNKWHFNRFVNPCLFDCNKWQFNRLLNVYLSRFPTCSQRAISCKYQSPNSLTQSSPSPSI